MSGLRSAAAAAGFCAGRVVALPSGAKLDLSPPALIMAIVNCTDDSFYAGSRNRDADDALSRALKAAGEGADIIDFGGESTRPGAEYVSEEDELRRVIPVIKAFRCHSRLPISVDTRKAAVARQALDAGADIINDISALEDDPSLGPLCAGRRAPVILTHKKGLPGNMQDRPFYDNIIEEVVSYLTAAAERARSYGIPGEHIILDPGIGFGKRLEDNLDILANWERFRDIGYPLLAGLSRKSFIGELTGREIPRRLAGTLAANALCLIAGVEILRVHDVPETADLVKVIHSIHSARSR
jgi:dihydropteroate synthase